MGTPESGVRGLTPVPPLPGFGTFGTAAWKVPSPSGGPLFRRLDVSGAGCRWGSPCAVRFCPRQEVLSPDGCSGGAAASAARVLGAGGGTQGAASNVPTETAASGRAGRAQACKGDLVAPNVRVSCVLGRGQVAAHRPSPDRTADAFADEMLLGRVLSRTRHLAVPRSVAWDAYAEGADSGCDRTSVRPRHWQTGRSAFV